MAVYTLFSQAATGSLLTSDPSPYTLGVQFSLSQAGTLTGIWWYSAVGAGNLPETIALFAIAGSALVHSEAASWSGASGSGWVRAAFSAAPSLAASTDYVAAVFDDAAGGSWYSGFPSWWNAGPGNAGITNGPLSAPSNSASVNGQDIFFSGGTLTFPSSTFNSNNYWVDPEVTVTPAFLAPPQRPAGQAVNRASTY